MGVRGLMKLLDEVCPTALKERDLRDYFGRVIALDGSLMLYALAITICAPFGNDAVNDMGSNFHLMGTWHRTLKLMREGVRPMYVFDRQREPSEEGSPSSPRRTVITRRQIDECKQLLRLMGVPVIDAEGEAEAQCAALCRAGKVFAAASEDMDTLAFGSPVLIRNLFTSSKVRPTEIHLAAVLAGLELTLDQFIDLCILLGCDYCATLRGIGPRKALAMIKEFGCIEEVLNHLKRTSSTWQEPADFRYEEARQLFRNPEIADLDSINLKWENPQETELIDFLVKEKGFDESRVRSGIAALKPSQGPTQKRLDSFFAVTKPPSAPKQESSSTRPTTSWTPSTNTPSSPSSSASATYTPGGGETSPFSAFFS